MPDPIFRSAIIHARFGDQINIDLLIVFAASRRWRRLLTQFVIDERISLFASTPFFLHMRQGLRRNGTFDTLLISYLPSRESQALN